MQLPILLQEDLHFACHACGDCCRQPYRVLIDGERAAVLRNHDFGRYPQLRGKTMLGPSGDGRKDLFEITKGDGHRCVFLDDSNRCIIHAELGADAKPAMCREFPLLSSVTWNDRRVSASYACPSVREARGPTLAESKIETFASLPRIEQDVVDCATVRLTEQVSISRSAFDALVGTLCNVFDSERVGDIWSAFAAALQSCATAASDSTSPLAATPSSYQPQSFRQPAHAPLPARLLFAVTLYPDAVPAGTVSRLRLKDRLTMVPRLMSLSRMSGLYASRLLERNISIDAVLKHDVGDSMDDEAAALLRAYFRTRFWQRLLIGTRMPVVAGIHQHILDLNAILFLARAAAHHAGATRLNKRLVGDALALVEFHISNQARLHQHALRRWLMSALSDAGIALASLGLMRLATPAPAGPMTVNQK